MYNDNGQFPVTEADCEVTENERPREVMITQLGTAFQKFHSNHVCDGELAKVESCCGAFASSESVCIIILRIHS